MSAALDGELSAEERRALDEHLAGCPDCAELFAELAGQSAMLRRLDCEVPAGLSRQILSQLPPQTKKKTPIVHLRRWGTLAACLALVVVGSFALGSPFGLDSDKKADAAAYVRAAEAAPAASSLPELAEEPESNAVFSKPAEVNDTVMSAETDTQTYSMESAVTPAAADSAAASREELKQQASTSSQATAEQEIDLSPPETVPFAPDAGSEAPLPDETVDIDPIRGVEGWAGEPEFSFSPQISPIGSGEGADIRGVSYIRTEWLDLGKVEPVLITAPEELARIAARYSDYSGKLAEALSAYDGEFFRSSSLIAVVVEEGSGSITHTVESILPGEDSWNITITAHIPEVGTCDMAGWLILIETDPVFSAEDRFTVSGRRF